MNENAKPTVKKIYEAEMVVVFSFHSNENAANGGIFTGRTIDETFLRKAEEAIGGERFQRLLITAHNDWNQKGRPMSVGCSNARAAILHLRIKTFQDGHQKAYIIAFPSENLVLLRSAEAQDVNHQLKLIDTERTKLAKERASLEEREAIVKEAEEKFPNSISVIKRSQELNKQDQNLKKRIQKFNAREKSLNQREQAFEAKQSLNVVVDNTGPKEKAI